VGKIIIFRSVEKGRRREREWPSGVG